MERQGSAYADPGAVRPGPRDPLGRPGGGPPGPPEIHFHPLLRAFLEEGDALGQALREALARRADRTAASWARELPEAIADRIRWLDELEAADWAAARMRAAGGRKAP